MRSLARRSASHSSSTGARLKRFGASIAPGSISTRVSPHSTYVAIDRTPNDSAARGMTFIRAPPISERLSAIGGVRGPYLGPRIQTMDSS